MPSITATCSVARVASLEVCYFHVELPSHDGLLAEGLPVEPYPNTGDRSDFENGGGAMRLHPRLSTRMWDAAGYATLVVTGPVLDRVRRQLDQRATALSRTRLAACASR